MPIPVELRIEMSGDAIPLDLSPVHVVDLLKLTESVDDYLPNSEGLQPSSTLEIPWASDALGRMLCAIYGWDDSAWTIEESGILATPVYYDRDLQEAQLVKVTHDSPATDPARYWRWVAELRCLCYLLKINRGSLHVCHAGHVNTNAIVLGYTYVFDSQETAALWGVLLSLKQIYRIPKENLQP